MKARKVLQRYQYPFYALCLAPQAWSSLHGKVVLYEAALYCFALASSLFLAALTLGGWGGLGDEPRVLTRGASLFVRRAF